MHSPATFAAQGLDHRSHALGKIHVGLSLGNNKLIERDAEEVGGRGAPGPGAGPAVAKGVELERAHVDVEGDGAAVAPARVAGLGC